MSSTSHTHHLPLLAYLNSHGSKETCTHISSPSPSHRDQQPPGRNFSFTQKGGISDFNRHLLPHHLDPFLLSVHCNTSPILFLWALTPWRFDSPFSTQLLRTLSLRLVCTYLYSTFPHHFVSWTHSFYWQFYTSFLYIVSLHKYKFILYIYFAFVFRSRLSACFE